MNLFPQRLLQRWEIYFVETLCLRLINSSEEFPRLNVFNRLEPTALHQFSRCFDGLCMEVGNPHTLVCRIKSLVSPWILRGYTNRTPSTVANQCLDAPERHHHSSRAVACRCSERHHLQNVEAGDDLSCCKHFDVVEQTEINQCFFHKCQRIVQRHTEIICKLERRRTSSSFSSIDGDKIGNDARHSDRLADVDELLLVSNTDLKPYRLSITQVAQHLEKSHQSFWSIKLRMTRW